MCTNPWKETVPFDVMLTDDVSFYGKRNNNDIQTTVRASVFPATEAETFVETDIDSDIKVIKVSVPVEQFKSYDIKNRPCVGDRLETDDGLRYKVSEINLQCDWYDITARSY